MSLDAGIPDERVKQLVVLTERLTGLMRKEAEAFETHRPHDALKHADETARLANLYRHESAKVRHDPSLVAAASEANRRKLIEATRAFDTALARHGRALEAAKVVTEGLVKAIAEEVAAQKAPGAGYGPGAAARDPGATAITLNRRA
jgi:hypothetical protein